MHATVKKRNVSLFIMRIVVLAFDERIQYMESIHVRVLKLSGQRQDVLHEHCINLHFLSVPLNDF